MAVTICKLATDVMSTGGQRQQRGAVLARFARLFRRGVMARTREPCEFLLYRNNRQVKKSPLRRAGLKGSSGLGELLGLDTLDLPIVRKQRHVGRPPPIRQNDGNGSLAIRVKNPILAAVRLGELAQRIPQFRRILI